MIPRGRGPSRHLAEEHFRLVESGTTFTGTITTTHASRRNPIKHPSIQRRQFHRPKWYRYRRLSWMVISTSCCCFVWVILIQLDHFVVRSIRHYDDGTDFTKKDKVQSPRLRYSSSQQTREKNLFEALAKQEDAIQRNLPTEYHINEDWRVPLRQDTPDNVFLTTTYPKVYSPKLSIHGQFFRISRTSKRSIWEEEWEQYTKTATRLIIDLKTDYTQSNLYDYPDLRLDPLTISDYPPLRSLKDIFQIWPQDEIDTPPVPIHEVLQHFNFTNHTELATAGIYRERKLPFKLINVPELIDANRKWTDTYLTAQFDSPHATIQGKCQESSHHFFPFFQPTAWNVEYMGIPPTRNNDYTFAQWANHANYADAVQLSPQKPHFYWQAGVPPEERQDVNKNTEESSFVSRDLPSFSSPEPTFISPEPTKQKGIQCRFGERGVTTAIHYDAGQNMIGMIQGAKRYILHPPKECHKLGIVTSRHSTFFRHSLLELGKLVTSSDHGRPTTNSPEEEAWLHRASTSEAVETVLKAGEVLFVPSHWFHYIIGLQRNAQCNVRSGVDLIGTAEFGSAQDVTPERCDARTRS